MALFFSVSKKQLTVCRFTYFEYLADVQMLAMLSCIFWEPEEKEAISTANLHPLESVSNIPESISPQLTCIRIYHYQ